MEKTSDNPRNGTGLRFKLGLFFLLFNFPFGYGGAALCAAMAAASGRKSLWLIAGALVYGLSWIMFGAGILMAGPEGLKAAKAFRKRLFSRGKETGAK